MELRARLDAKSLDYLSRDEVKKIQLEVIEGENAVAKLHTGDPSSQTTQLFEKTKLYDKIF